MKIFYAVQGTGNGHVSRAIEMLPHLKQLGHVDIFLSGANSHLEMKSDIRYRSKGVSLFFNSTGGLDYWKILRGIHPLQLRKEIQDLPVEKYDLVINDFEFITAAACARKKIPSVQLGHQASFQSALTPRPANRQAIGEWVLKNYARASSYIGLHFARYDDFILPPVIQKSIRNAVPIDKGHITVYLPSFSKNELENIFREFKHVHFQFFCKEIKSLVRIGNLTFLPVNKELFSHSLIHSHGIICGAGFETPAEAIFLGKKMICIPTRGQYEQICNAAALEKIGVHCLKKVDDNFPAIFQNWLNCANAIRTNYEDSIPLIIENLQLHSERFEEQRYYLQSKGEYAFPGASI